MQRNVHTIPAMFNLDTQAIYLVAHVYEDNASDESVKAKAAATTIMMLMLMMIVQKAIMHINIHVRILFHTQNVIG